MADSLCGPSNALQTFQKHSTVDRTLQQDRLISRPSPSQGFRSSPGPNGGLAESDFQAFQAGNLPIESHQGFQPQPFSHAPPNLQQVVGPSAWASDFQRLHISSPQPQTQFQQQNFNTPLQQRQDTGGWHQDFAQQFQGGGQQAMSGPSQMSAQIGASPAYGYQPTMQGMGMLSAPMMGAPAEQLQQQNHQPIEAFDEEAFARAFEEAAQSETNTQQDSNQGQKQDIQGQDIMIEESAERLMASDEQVINQERLGADLIHDPMQENQPHPTHEDPDALARTAGQLLDSVRNNQSDKFQNSQFLELMRQLRDREVMVQGDNIVDAQNGGEDNEGLKNELIYLFRTLKRLVLDRDRKLASNASQRARRVLTILLQLNELNAHSYNMNEKGSVSYVRIHRTLQAVINSPDLAHLPAIRNVARLTLLNFETEAITNTPASPLPEELNAVCLANAEIIFIPPPSETALETLIYNYISDSLQSLPGTFNQDPLNALLGYTFEDRNDKQPYTHSTSNQHIQRSREIMGRSISECIDVCQGFWCELLEVERFFELETAHQTYGGIKSVEFRKLLAEVEGDIEEGLKAGIERARNGHPYYFGVQDLGVRKLGYGEEPSYENSLLKLEAQERLRRLQVRKFRREAGEKEGVTGDWRKSGEEKSDAWIEGRHTNQQ